MSSDREGAGRKESSRSVHKIATARKSARANQSIGKFTALSKRRSTNLGAMRKRKMMESPLRLNDAAKKKSLKRKISKSNKGKNQKRRIRTVSIGRATVPVTPQMIRDAVKELQTRRVYISSALIGNHLRRCYPVEHKAETLKAELIDKLNCAVSVGLIAKCGEDKYCMPTLRQQANMNKTAFTAFWERYYRNGRKTCRPTRSANLSACKEQPETSNSLDDIGNDQDGEVSENLRPNGDERT